MAKSKSPKPSGESVESDRLTAALRAFEEGDVVRGRRLAEEVIAQGSGGDASAVKKAAERMGLDPATSPELVAQALVTRSMPPPRAFLFGLAVLAVMGLLLVLASARYAAI